MFIICLGIIILTGTTYAADSSTNNGTNNLTVSNQSQNSYAGGNGSSGTDPNRQGSAYPKSTSLPHNGTVKMVVILIDFPDYPHNSSQTVEEMQSLYFGDGSEVNDPTENPYPYESLHNWYLRSSYGALNITGDVYGWYTAQHDRDYYTGNAEDLIMEAINYYDDTVDFSQYDNNQDGIIEGLAIKWTGPVGDWSSDWWPYMTSWYNNPDFSVDNVTLGPYTWEDYSPSIKTDIHETGHLLGLPDLYDYDTQTGNCTNINGPGWGVGGLDMMDGVDCDFNAFFKLLFGWITPYYLNNTSALDQQIILNSMESNSTHGCVVIYTGNFSLYGTEMYIVEYRNQTGNDKNLPASGLYIWHIDTTMGDDGQYYYDNTGTIHNLIDLIQADGLFDIQNGTHWSDEGDVYVFHKYLGTNTTPNSNWYNGTPGIYVYDINNTGSFMSAYFGWNGPPGIGSSVGNQDLNWTTGGSKNSIWTGTRINGQNDTISAYSGYIHDNESSWISTIVNGYGFLSFDWKVSSEDGYDFLSFYIDGVLQNQISGEVDWQNLNFTLEPGMHVLNWTYSKDDWPNSASGSDCGWLDNVVWDNVPPVVNNIDPLNNTFVNVVNKTISIVFSENIAAGAAFNDIGVVGSSGVVSVSKSILGNLLLLIPSADLTEGKYTVNIPENAISDIVGNNQTTAFTSTFTVDTTGPNINSISPVNNTLNPIENIIRIVFSENITAGAAFNDIGVVGSSGVVSVSKNIAGNVLILTPTSSLGDGNYVINVPENSIKDSAGNSLKDNLTSNFSIDKTGPIVWPNIKGGYFNIAQVISLNTNEVGSIYYTLDGSTPTNTSNKYTDPIVINNTTILKFLAIDEAGNPSNVYTETYNIDKTSPLVWTNVGGGLYNVNKVITLSMNEEGVIYYTLNGSTPTNSSLKYSGPITVSSTTVLKFFAVDKAGNPSAVSSVTYSIDKIAPKVVLTYPKNGISGFSRTANIYIKFSENFKASTNWSKIIVKNKYGKVVSITKWISGNVLYIKTNSKRSANSYYTIYIPGSALKDAAGNNLASTYSFRFKTGR